MDLVAHPGGIADAVGRGGDADHAPLAVEPVDVGVGDRQHDAEAAGRRLHDLVELQAGGELETGLKEELIAPLEAVARR